MCFGEVYDCHEQETSTETTKVGYESNYGNYFLEKEERLTLA